MKTGRRELPRVLVIDDVFGRRLPDGPNYERANLCNNLLLDDVTGDKVRFGGRAEIKTPLAEAVFCRAQKPVCAASGDVVENDLDGCLEVVRSGWNETGADAPPWALVLLDLCFNTGQVPPRMHEGMDGVPDGCTEDEQSYFGLKVLEAVRLEFPDLPVVVLSGQPLKVRKGSDALGALAFIESSKPDARERFQDHLILLCQTKLLVLDHVGKYNVVC